MYGLTEAEGRQLLNKYLTGSFGAGANRQATINGLIHKRMITLSPDAKFIIVTPLGKQWCDEHHMDTNLVSAVSTRSKSTMGKVFGSGFSFAKAEKKAKKVIRRMSKRQ